MKKSIIVVFCFGVAFPSTKKNIKQELEECQRNNVLLSAQLKKAAESSDNITLNYPCSKSKQDVKIQKEITKREVAKVKAETKQNRTNERYQTKRNVIYQIGSFAKTSTFAFIIICSISFFLGTPVGAFIKSFFGKK